jgi:hypothetical protein
MAKSNDEKPSGDKPNDSASRAGQFLDGPVTQAFCSPDQAGYRCATQTPGCEPTGFTGQCTKQPEVGGAWPCITAMPFCAEPTGYTGQCTDQPWPNPTRYVGCTVLHCPTNDLTHQPQICRVVEEGLRGGAPPQAKGDANAEAPGAHPTALLGCGYTQTWGICPTHLLGCGYTKQWGPQCPPQQQQQNFAAAPQPPTYPNGDCTFFGCPPQTLLPQQCPSVANPCIPPTETPDCNAQVGGVTIIGVACRTVIICPQLVTTQPQCFLRITQRCPEFTPGCPWITPKVTPVNPTPVFRAGGFGGGGGFVGAAGGGGGQTAATVCTQYGPGCHTYPNGDCTFFGCGPQGGGGGQTAATVCTQYGPGCFTYPNGDCTFFGCPPQTLIPQQCQSVANPCIPPTETPDCGAQVGGVTIIGNACRTIFICPQQVTLQPQCFLHITQRCPEFTPGCPWITPKVTPVDPTPIFRGGFGGGGFGGGGGFVGAAGGGGALNAAITAPTPATRCFVCDPVAANAAAIPHTAATVCTQFGPGCHTYPNGDCTFFGCGPHGYGGGQTAATVCTQFGHQCQSAVDACPTRLCGGGGEVGAIPNTAATVCTQFGPGCHTYPNGDCTFFGCGPHGYGGGGGGQTQFSHQCQSAVDACPTRLCGGGGEVGAANIGIAPTPATRCFICPPPYGGGNWPTPMTRCFIC